MSVTIIEPFVLPALKLTRPITEILNREQKRCMNFLAMNMHTLHANYFQHIQAADITYTNSKAFVLEKINPSQFSKHGIKWNQSRRKVDVETDNLLIVVRKYIPRKMPGMRFKMWTCEISTKLPNETFIGTFVWCERGHERISESLLTEIIHSEFV